MADEIIYDKNISQVTTPELAENKNGVSHGVKESINILSGAGQKSLPFNQKYDEYEILSIKKQIEKGKYCHSLVNSVLQFTSRTREDSYVFFTERKDSENRSIIIPTAVNKRKGRIIINEITSMYDRNNESYFIHSSIETGNLVCMDKKETKEWEKKISLAWKRESWVQFPGRRPPELQGYMDSILTKERLVNFA